MHFDLISLIQTVGLLGVFAIVFIESGLLVGFFLPGDSLLFTAGFLASQDFFNIYVLVIGCFIAAVTGDSAGYYIGHKFGRRLFNKENSLFFHKDHLLKAEEFYEKHGGKAIILARFMPVVRTFAPVVAGVGKMHYQTFLFYNLIGGILWAIGMTLAGFYIGSLIPADKFEKYLIVIVIFIIFASVAPGAYHLLKEPQTRKKLIDTLFKRNK